MQKVKVRYHSVQKLELKQTYRRPKLKVAVQVRFNSFLSVPAV